MKNKAKLSLTHHRLMSPSPEQLSGSWKLPCCAPDGKVKIAFIRCHAIRETGEKDRDVIDLETQIEHDGARLRLYFQPALSPGEQ